VGYDRDVIQRQPRNVDVDAARDSAQRVVEIHRRLASWLAPGVTLAKVDAFVAEQLDDLRCKSCFLHYKVPKCPPFPSYSCLSVNDCVVHGTAGMSTAPLKPGDVFSIDIGVSHKGWIGDAAWTYVVGEMDDLRSRLTACGRESLRRGVAALQPGGVYLDFAKAVQQHVEDECGFCCVRGLGGHGYGRKLHTPPFVANTTPGHPGEWPDAFTKIEPGTLLAVEPMIAVGTGQVAQGRGQWPIFTADGSLSVHYEHDVYISDTGPVTLTEGLEELPDVVE